MTLIKFQLRGSFSWKFLKIENPGNHHDEFSVIPWWHRKTWRNVTMLNKASIHCTVINYRDTNLSLAENTFLLEETFVIVKSLFTVQCLKGFLNDKRWSNPSKFRIKTVVIAGILKQLQLREDGTTSTFFIRVYKCTSFLKINASLFCFSYWRLWYYLA